MRLVLLTLILLGTQNAKTATVVRLAPSSNATHLVLKFMFQVGSVEDPADKLGLTYLTARNLVEGGTKAKSKQEIDELLYPFATHFSLSFDKEVAVFTTLIHRDHLDQVYPIFRDLFLAPRFDPVDFNRIKESTLKRVTKDLLNNNDEVLSKRVLDGLMFENHAYGHLVEGSKTTLQSISLEDVQNQFRTYFSRSRLVIGLAGAYNQAFKKRVVTDMNQLPGGSLRGPLPKARAPKGIEVRIISKGNAFGTAVFMGFPMEVNRSSDDFAALLVANSYLGEHRNSYGLLYRELRSKRSLNYGDYTYMEWYPAGHANQLPNPGMYRSQNFFSMWIRPVQIADQFTGIEGLEKPALGNGIHAIRQVILELETFLKEGLQEADFQRTRAFFQGYLRHYVQSPANRLGHLMDGKLHGRNDYIEEMIRLIGKLTLADVNRALAKHLQAKNFYIAIITDDSEADKLAEALRNNSSAPIVYKPTVRSGLDPEILARDKLIDAHKLNITKVEVLAKDQLFQ